MTAARRTPARRTDVAATGVTPWWNALVRVVAAVAAAVAIAVGAIALLRIEWAGAGLDAAPVTVANMSFSPLVAIVTLAAGVVALLAAVSPDRGSKLFVGALLIVAGIVVLMAGTTEGRWAIEEGHAWLSIVVGVVLVAAGVLLRPTIVDAVDEPVV
jgi:hypothetical protein